MLTRYCIKYLELMNLLSGTAMMARCKTLGVCVVIVSKHDYHSFTLYKADSMLHGVEVSYSIQSYYLFLFGFDLYRVYINMCIWIPLLYIFNVSPF